MFSLFLPNKRGNTGGNDGYDTAVKKIKEQIKKQIIEMNEFENLYLPDETSELDNLINIWWENKDGTWGFPPSNELTSDEMRFLSDDTNQNQTNKFINFFRLSENRSEYIPEHLLDKLTVNDSSGEGERNFRFDLSPHSREDQKAFEEVPTRRWWDRLRWRQVSAVGGTKRKKVKKRKYNKYKSRKYKKTTKRKKCRRRTQRRKKPRKTKKRR
jgi:hypothetical protein